MATRKPKETDALEPRLSLLVKLGSIAVHAGDLLSPSGHEFDRQAIAAILGDAEVVDWIGTMTRRGHLPVRRRGRDERAHGFPA